VIGIVGNKSDLFTKEAVSETEAQQFADENELVFKLVSAKANTSIDMFFKEITEKCFSISTTTNADEDEDDNRMTYTNKVNLKESKQRIAKKQCC
jgi:GTPase SAR1 family protein